jgi:hypothetical protein
MLDFQQFSRYNKHRPDKRELFTVCRSLKRFRGNKSALADNIAASWSPPAVEVRRAFVLFNQI